MSRPWCRALPSSPTRVHRSWIYKLLARDRAKGEKGREPGSRSSSQKLPISAELKSPRSQAA
jgi:hypothetical protein